MNLILVQFLSFMSVLLFVLGLDQLRRGAKAASTIAARPGLFGWFPEEINAVGQLVEPGITSLFPEESQRVHNQLLAAALENELKVRDVRGLQVLLGFSVSVMLLLLVFVITLEGSVGGADRRIVRIAGVLLAVDVVTAHGQGAPGSNFQGIALCH